MAAGPGVDTNVAGHHSVHRMASARPVRPLSLVGHEAQPLQPREVAAFHIASGSFRWSAVVPMIPSAGSIASPRAASSTSSRPARAAISRVASCVATPFRAAFHATGGDRLIYMAFHYIVMKNLQVRIEDEDIDALDALAEDMRSTRSEVARHALGEGMRKLRMEKALNRYLNLEFSLARAAQFAGVTIREMAEAASARGIPYFRYSVEELRRDRERAAKWLKD